MTPRDRDGPLYLGWEYATPHSDPGPPPRRPVPQQRQRLSGDWLAAQRREESLINRPLKMLIAVTAGIAVALGACVACGLVRALLAAPTIAILLMAAALAGSAIWRGERVLRGRIEAEQLRVKRLRADQDEQLFAWQSEHERQLGEWQQQRFAFEAQKRWYAVPVPDGIDRVDIAGGTLSGWSALLTMVAAHRLAMGGEVTVIDLSGGAVAADLVDLSVAAGGIDPAVWVLPRDLPKLDLASSLRRGELADVLALSVSVVEERSSARELAIDSAILDRVIAAIEGSGGDGGGDGNGGGGKGGGGAISLARVAAALRALAQVGDVRADVTAGLLTEREAASVAALYGQGATDRVVLERALGIEAQLRKLAEAGSHPADLPRGRLRVIAIDKRTGPLSAKLLGSFVITALTHLAERVPVGGGPTSWRHTLVVLGAERLRDDVLDRLTDACEAARSGLVLAYRSMPPPVRQRIGRGNAAVAFMRLGNAEEAKAASEQIGAEHRFVVSQLTDTVGTSVTDTLGGSYTSTVGDSASAAKSTSDSESTSDGSGYSLTAGQGVLPFGGGGGRSRSGQAGTSRGTSESVSLTAGISTSTAWGVSTSRATGDSESLARSLQRSRELIVEPSELQRLPVTAMIVSYAAPGGRQVLLADANPAIGALRAATLTPLHEVGEVGEVGEAQEKQEIQEMQGMNERALNVLRPNLGPPPSRLDWRSARRR
jgi:hypothetical protein